MTSGPVNGSAGFVRGEGMIIIARSVLHWLAWPSLSCSLAPFVEFVPRVKRGGHD